MKVKLAYTLRGHFIKGLLKWLIPGFIILFSACGPAPSATPSDQSKSMASSETVGMVETKMTDTPKVQPIIIPTEITPSPTFFLVLPITETIPLTQTIPLTSDSTGALIRATIDTNCRFGPGPVYDVVGYLLANTTAKVMGKLEAGGWYYIENPTLPGGFCWVWTQSTVIEGNTSQLAFVAPPPTPTGAAPVNFTVSFAGIYDCGGAPNSATFSVKNTGFQNLESGEILVIDTWNDKVINKPRANDSPFLSGPCTSGASQMKTGTVFMVATNLKTLPERGHAKATITLCTEDDLDGGCFQRAVNFAIP